MKHTGFSNVDLSIERNSVAPVVITMAAKQNDRSRGEIAGVFFVPSERGQHVGVVYRSTREIAFEFLPSY